MAVLHTKIIRSFCLIISTEQHNDMEIQNKTGKMWYYLFTDESKAAGYMKWNLNKIFSADAHLGLLYLFCFLYDTNCVSVVQNKKTYTLESNEEGISK